MSGLKSSAKKIRMASVDELFQTEEELAENAKEKIQEVALTELFPFRNHPFRVLDDDSMMEMAESVKTYGVLVPALARPLAGGGYELVAGHRRKRASELAGKKTMPVLIRDMDDDEATIVLVDSNIQRENLFPSEKAWAYKMKMNALNHKGVACGQIGHKSREELAERSNDSGRQIQRYIRLTELIPELLQMVDDKKLAFNPAVELSYLISDEQHQLQKLMQTQYITPSLEQAKRLKEHSQKKTLSFEMMCEIMRQESVMPQRITLKSKRLQKYFPRNYTQKQIEDVIFSLLERWKEQSD